MGAGILPVAFNGISLMFLLGKEQNNQWSDFGGSQKNVHEPTFNTAVREGHEELNGLLGCEYKLSLKIKNNYLMKYYHDRYTTYLFKTDFDNNLPKYFNNNYNFIRNTTPFLINKDNGLYEKKEINWFTIDEIYDLELRPFYKKIIFPIIENPEKIEMLLSPYSQAEL